VSDRRIPKNQASATGAAARGAADLTTTFGACDPYDAGASVVSLIGACAASDATADAIVFGKHVIGYAELEARAAALARHLQSLGAMRGSVIGLLAVRSIAYVVGALGIMKVGAAYLPLQVGEPERRADFQLDGAGTELVVAEESWAGSGGSSPRTIVRLAQDGSLSKNEETRSISRSVTSEDLAYVIYTSGSTGQPKGVEVTHRNLLHLIRWHRHAFDVTAADRASLVSSTAVDAAVWELWPYLAAGATVHIPDNVVAKDPEALRDWLIAEKITISFAPAPMAERLMELRWPPKTDLRILLTGGDVLHSYPPPDLPFKVVNNYGPTECTVVATSAALNARDPGHGLPPIGKPIADTRIYILDQGMRPVPHGEVGEIWIGGAGVARGYRNRPGLTAERFMSDPFCGGDGARVYGTGDYGRILPDGQIAFMGRKDEQVKVRGFRVEPGEVEYFLNQHPAVKQSAVSLIEVAPGNKRLIAHLTIKTEQAPSFNELQAFLGEHLAEHMIPSGFVQLAKFPLLPSGKIDRGALPPPDLLNALADQSHVAASTITEKRLQEIVSSLLKTKSVSVSDNFFMLGGHSLLAAQLIARVRDAFGIEIGLRFLFEYPTVTAIAREIERIVLLNVAAMTDEQARQALERDWAVARESS
jgi:amino acid adenylation domain-containing protein